MKARLSNHIDCYYPLLRSEVLKRILFVVNNPAFFLSHRLPLGLAAKRDGYEVHVATPDGPAVEVILNSGLAFHEIPIAREKANPLSEIRTLAALYGLYRRLKPNIVHHVTIKPVLYGTLAARLAGVPAVANAISGLGYVFMQSGMRGRIIRSLAKALYRICLRHPRQKIIFQNLNDAAVFEAEGLVRNDETVIIRGSGVDLEAFKFIPETPGVPIVALAARMLKDKGIAEFVEAARQLKQGGRKARFVLIGDTDTGNPTSLSRIDLQKWVDSGIIEWWGFRNDIADIFASAHIVCLPSYREGLSKVLIEGAAAGRPIVTTDVPGCRDVVRHGYNGLLVPARDADGLANALTVLIEDGEMRKRMGALSRLVAEEEFSLERVVSDHLKLYRSLLA